MQIDTNKFSEREKDVVKSLLQGKSNKQIALVLGISNRTVEFHLGNIYAKLGVASRAEAILKLTENHLWESTGNSPSNVQGESTVEQAGDSTENGIKPISRRISMKNLFYLISGGLLTTALIAIMLVSNLPAQSLDPTPTLLIEQTLTTSFDNPTATLMATVQPIATSTVEAAYERISPSKIRIPSIDLTIELSGRLTQSVLIVTTDISVPEAFPFETEPLFIYDQSVAIKGEILSTPSLPLILEYAGGGGGSGIENGFYWGSDNSSYNIKTPLTVGQKIKITIPVTFNNSKYMEDVIPFVMELIVKSSFNDGS